jgi:acyl-coenzyme A synthetase/AMP-(fatty) acid ligase
MPNMTDYEQTCREFRLEVPEFFNYATDVVDRWAAEAPDKLALVAVEPDGITAHRFSFGDISAASDRAAALLAGLGVNRGDRVFVMLPRLAQWYAVLLGCWKLGAVPMPGTVLLTPRDIAYRINVSEAVMAVTDGDGMAKVDEAAPECPSLRQRVLVGGEAEDWVDFDAETAARANRTVEPVQTRSDDPLLIYFTSGTTAHPKMVLHTHASYGVGHEITARFWHDLTPDDLHWTLSDTGWAKAAWGKLFGQWRLGAAILMWNAPGKPDFDRMLRIIGEQGVTSFCAPPTVFRAFAQLDLSVYDWGPLRHTTSAGEPLNPEVISVWKEATGLDIYDGYGQTETTNLVANYPCLEVRPGSMGKPAPGFDVHIVDDEGKILPAGEEGHIAVRTDPRPVGLFQEYWRDPDLTAHVFRNGWYYTGDRAYAVSSPHRPPKTPRGGSAPRPSPGCCCRSGW